MDDEVKPLLGFKSAAYPNPFLRLVTIEFTLPETGRTIVQIMDMYGKMLEEKDLGIIKAGNNYLHEFRPGSKFSAATYLYRIVSGKYIERGKLLYVK